MEQRSRVSLGSVEVHIGQPQPMTGMPCEVPVPRKVILKMFVFLEALWEVSH